MNQCFSICRFSAATAFLCLAAQALAPALADDGNELLQPPEQRPVEVTMSVELVEVSQIQDHDEKFEVEFYLYQTWNDPRLAFDAGKGGREKRLLPADRIWTPQPELRDDLEVEVQDGRNAHVHADGTVMWRQYYRGTISSNFDLHEFPFDRHRLEVSLEAGSGEIDDVVYLAGESGVRDARTSETVHVVPHGWSLLGLSSETTEASYPRLGETYSRFVFRVEVKRDPHFYWWAIVLPLLPIVATSWSVFWMDPKEFSSQVGVGVTAMLTVVAYRITIDSSLPPLSYMTRMDYFLLVCQVWVFGAFLMSLVVHVCHACETKERMALAYSISQFCRWLPPLALAATCVLLAWLPPRLAMATIGCAAGGLLLACRPTPSRVALWLRILLFPENSLDDSPGDDGQQQARRAA
jgi:hypothetical protein